MRVLRIKDWNQHFETAEMKRVKRLSWVAVPTKHDGKNYRRLVRTDAGVAIFGIWVILLQVAAKSPVRGYLADEDGPLSDEDLEIKTGAPASLIGQAIEHLTNVVGWMEFVEIESMSGLAQQSPGRATDASVARAATGQTEQDGQNHTGSVPGSEMASGKAIGSGPSEKQNRKRGISVFLTVTTDTLKNPHLLRRWFIKQQGESKNRVLDPGDPDAWLFCIAAAEHSIAEGRSPPAMFSSIVGGKQREQVKDKHWTRAAEIVREFPVLNGALT